MSSVENNPDFHCCTTLHSTQDDGKKPPPFCLCLSSSGFFRAWLFFPAKVCASVFWKQRRDQHRCTITFVPCMLCVAISRKTSWEINNRQSSLSSSHKLPFSDVNCLTQLCAIFRRKVTKCALSYYRQKLVVCYFKKEKYAGDAYLCDSKVGHIHRLMVRHLFFPQKNLWKVV